MSLEVIDIIFTVIILLVGFGGFKKGFFSQLITIVGIISGLFFAYFFSDDLSPYISNVIGEKVWINIVSFILIFVVVILITLLLNKIFKSALEKLGTEGLDRVLGFSFGLVQGLFICIGITALLTIQPFFDPDPIFRDSIIGGKIISALPELEKLFPETDMFLNNMDESLGV